MDGPPDDATRKLHGYDFAVLATLCALLFGVCLVGPRPLTWHEAVLPQSSREMLADRDWIVPKCGGRPWLERPPAPQWITAAVGALFGGCDREWVVRIPSVLIGTGVVLATAWVVAASLGRSMGLLAGAATATLFEVASYSWLAEQDIFLCGVITAASVVFIRLESRFREKDSDGWSFLGGRSRETLLFFLIMGSANLVKGIAFGPVLAAAPMAIFLLSSRSFGRIKQYLWLWGWLAFFAVALPWPFLVSLRHPDVWDVWSYDHLGRLSGQYQAINQPWWYYFSTLPWEIAPWTPAALFGAATVVRNARHSTTLERFALAWAIVPVAVLSLASGKHHHYLLSCMPAWGVLSAMGLEAAWRRLLHVSERLTAAKPEWIAAATAVMGGGTAFAFGAEQATAAAAAAAWYVCALIFIRGVKTSDGRFAAAAVVAGVVMTHWAIYCMVLPHRDGCLEDTQFFREVKRRCQGEAVYVNADLGTMDAFRILFYLDDRARGLHNLTYLADEKIQSPTVYVISRSRDKETMAKLGRVETVCGSRRSRRENSPDDRFTLFRLSFSSDIVRKLAPAGVSPMQALGREGGPYLIRL